MSSTNQGQSFVVLSDGLGKWRKGDVVEGTVLRESGCEVPRLMALKALREATSNERDSKHVALVSPERHLSYEHQLAEKDGEIVRLTSRVASLEEQMAAGNHLQKPAVTEANESSLIAEKDRAVRSLEGRVAALTQELATAKAEAATLRSELILARAEIGAAKSAAAADAKVESDKVADAKVESDKVEKAKAEPKAETKPRKAADPALPPPPPPAAVPMADNPGGLSRIRRVA